MEQDIKYDCKKKHFNIAVIGGGPSGMIAAGRAAQFGLKVVLIEKNELLGKKLLITGKGRCNLTHYQFDKHRLISNYGKKGRFLYSAIEYFGVLQVLEFFKRRGLQWNVERGHRVFPKNGDARDVLKVLQNFLKDGNVSVRHNSKVMDIIKKNDFPERFEITTGKEKIFSDCLIICTGGKSYPQTGSTGDGYVWAKKFGHTIVKLLPALNPVKTSELWVKNLQGLTLKNVSIKLYFEGKKKDERFGEMLFTHFGISGPIVMDISKHIGILLKEGKIKIWLDLKPALNFKKLDERIQRDFNKFKGRMFKNSLGELLPKSMIEVIINLSGIKSDKKVDYISREERKRMLHLIKELELTPTGLLGYKWSVVTYGGIDLREVNPDTMGSKKVSNLFFAGEILDLDGPSGGFNLQECWSTGYLAGECAARRSKIIS